MKNNPNSASGKIIRHGNGLGLSGDGDVEQRADEVARIEGHRMVSGEDRKQAKLELTGGAIPPGTDDDDEGIGSLSRDPSEPASSTGRQIPNLESEDEQFAAERLVSEGVTEAEYDQMLAARRNRKRD